MDRRIQFRVDSDLKKRAEDALPKAQTLSGFLRGCLEDLVDGQMSIRQSSSQVSAQGPRLSRDEAYHLVGLIQVAFNEDIELLRQVIRLLERTNERVGNLHARAFLEGGQYQPGGLCYGEELG